MNIKDFSKIAGYSTATISRVFANSDSVKPSTREKVMELAEKHNFRPNLAARASFGSATQSVGVLIGSLSTSYFADIVAGIQRKLLPKGYLPMIIDSREDTERNAIKRLIDHRVDGLIVSIADKSLSNEELKEIVYFNTPVIVLDKEGSELFDCVHSDEEQGGRMVGEHLLTLGHTRIGYAYVGEFGATARDRLEGIRQALASEDIEITEQNIVGFYDPEIPILEGIRRKLVEMLSRSDRPTAIYAYNDRVAYEVYTVAEKLHLNIPKDLSVVGHADLNYAQMLRPALTTVRQNGIETGQVAASMLLERLGRRKDSIDSRKRVLPVEFIERQSTTICPPIIKRGKR